MYQLCLGDESFDGLLDRVVDRACAVAPSAPRAAVRNLVELVFRARVRQTVACGSHPDCSPEGALWGEAAARAGATCDWQDLDPEALPAMFGVAAANLADVPASGRAAVEQRLAAAFRAVMAELIFVNPRCGRAAVCRAEPVFPLKRR